MVVLFKIYMNLKIRNAHLVLFCMLFLSSNSTELNATYKPAHWFMKNWQDGGEMKTKKKKKIKLQLKTKN